MESAPYVVLKELAGNPPPQWNALQEVLAPHISLLASFWISVWIMTAVVLAAKFWHAYKQYKNNSK